MKDRIMPPLSRTFTAQGNKSSSVLGYWYYIWYCSQSGSCRTLCYTAWLSKAARKQPCPSTPNSSAMMLGLSPPAWGAAPLCVVWGGGGRRRKGEEGSRPWGLIGESWIRWTALHWWLCRSNELGWVSPPEKKKKKKKCKNLHLKR